MGLLDGFFGSSMDDPRTMANFQLAAGLLGGGNFGQALGRGLGGYQQAMSASNEMARQKKKDTLFDEEMQWKRDERTQAASAREQHKNDLRMLQEAMGAGRMTGDELMRRGLSPSLIKEALSVQDMGLPEIARTIDKEGPNGSKITQGYDKRGNPVGEGITAYTAPVQVNRGGSTDFVKPQAGVSLPMTMSPAEQQRIAQGWEAQGLARERFKFEKEGGAKPQFNAELGGFVTAPSANNPQGSFTPLPGAGMAAPKLTEGESKASLYLGQMRSANDVLSRLEGQGVTASPVSVNMTGNMVGNFFAGKEARQIAQAQNQWSESYLRAKTGAAATEGEVKLNNATYFPQPNDDAETIAQKAQARAQAELDMTLPAGRGASRLTTAPPRGPSQQSAKPPPIRGQVVEGYKFKGGNPADPSSWEKQ